jgi:hypothetical protein
MSKIAVIMTVIMTDMFQNTEYVEAARDFKKARHELVCVGLGPKTTVNVEKYGHS